jgi:hypothetical protein
MEQVKNLEQALNGIHHPPEDPKALYPTLSLQKRLSLLSKLMQSNALELYSELLENDADLENSESFQAVLKSFKFRIKRS